MTISPLVAQLWFGGLCSPQVTLFGGDLLTPHGERFGLGATFAGSLFQHHSKNYMEAAFNFLMQSPQLLCGSRKNGFI